MDEIARRRLTAALKAEAHRLGFGLVGITSPDPPPHFSVYADWVARGHHGEMGYLATTRALTRRQNPRAIEPGCESILVVGMTYLPRQPPRTGKLAVPRVAAYAQGDDYHDIIPPRLDSLARWLETELGGARPYQAYTDTGPVLERDLAQRAGLGWIGKNTCLIHPENGSYFLLGELLLSVRLEYDEPFHADRCGACTRCIDACPTGCIHPDRTLDARRCISYLTIEQKGTIPFELREQLGTWLFGCDICQDVCPWNERFARVTYEPAFQPRPFMGDDIHLTLLNLEEASWRSRLKNSPLERPKRRGLVRNAVVAAGNLRDPSLLALLTRLLSEDPEPLVRAHAAWAIGCYSTPYAQAILEARTHAEGDAQVLKEIEAAYTAASVSGDV